MQRVQRDDEATGGDGIGKGQERSVVLFCFLKKPTSELKIISETSKKDASLAEVRIA